MLYRMLLAIASVVVLVGLLGCEEPLERSPRDDYQRERAARDAAREQAEREEAERSARTPSDDLEAASLPRSGDPLHPNIRVGVVVAERTREVEDAIGGAFRYRDPHVRVGAGGALPPGLQVAGTGPGFRAAAGIGHRTGSTHQETEAFVVVLSGHEASIAVGESRMTGTIYAGGGATVVVLANESVGTELWVLPERLDDGSIAVSVAPVVSRRAGGGRILVRELLTTVVVPDGGTVVLAGDREHSEGTIWSSFLSWERDRRASSVVIFLTAEVIG